MSEIAKKWYVVRAAGGKEKKAKEYIENEIKRLGLDDYVSQVLIPTEKIYQIKNGKRVSMDRIFYPGYIGMQIGARLEKFGLTFLILIALTAFAVIYPDLYIPLFSQLAIIPSKISAFVNKIYLDIIYR